MSPTEDMLPAVILAGGAARPEMAQAFGVTNKALIRVGGKTLLDTVAGALRESRVVGDIIVIGDVPTPSGARAVADAGSFIANLMTGLEACGSASHAIVSTSDMPFLSADTVAHFTGAAMRKDADLVYPIVDVAQCMLAYPGMRRTSIPVREGRFTGGNMVLARPSILLGARATIERAYAARKSPVRLALMLGLGVTLAVGLSIMLRRGFVTLGQLEGAASRLIGARARALVMDDPAIATDVDKPGDIEGLRLPPT